jgi:hypothetical protein
LTIARSSISVAVANNRLNKLNLNSNEGNELNWRQLKKIRSTRELRMRETN